MKCSLSSKAYMFLSSMVNYFQSLAEKALKLISPASRDPNYQSMNLLSKAWNKNPFK